MAMTTSYTYLTEKKAVERARKEMTDKACGEFERFLDLRFSYNQDDADLIRRNKNLWIKDFRKNLKDNGETI